jgi:hypothetical protein
MPAPMRPILVHMPEPAIKKLDAKARRLQISRSELICITLLLHAQHVELVIHAQSSRPVKQTHWLKRWWYGGIT